MIGQTIFEYLDKRRKGRETELIHAMEQQHKKAMESIILRNPTKRSGYVVVDE